MALMVMAIWDTVGYKTIILLRNKHTKILNDCNLGNFNMVNKNLRKSLDKILPGGPNFNEFLGRHGGKSENWRFPQGAHRFGV